MEAIGLGGEENAGRRLTVLRAIDKLDRLGIEGVRALLGDGRKDESGDFTKGAGLPSDGIRSVASFIEAVLATSQKLSATTAESFNAIDDYDKDWPIPNDVTARFEQNATYAEGTAELQDIHKLVRLTGYGDRRIRIDPSVVRGLEYYTGPVYEIELTFETKDEDGRPVRFGSVGGGGRYDGLVARFRGEPVPATGFSIGVSRLQAALSLLGKTDGATAQGPVVVTVFDRDRIADYQRMVQQLRNAGIRSELYLGSGKFGPQMKYADRRNAPCVVIQGSDEKAAGEVQVKDLVLGATLTNIKDRDEYLAKQAQAQRKVPEDQLVETVRDILARHARKPS
jgi:histidyl-tRNA synthetase